MTPRLVCFDLGRVLVRICEGWAEGFAAAGLPPLTAMPSDLDAHEIATVVHDLERGAIDHPYFVAKLSAALGVPAPDVEAVIDAWLLGPYPGGDRLLASLGRAGIATACLSNTNERHWKLMASWADGLLAHFTHAFPSHLIGVRKPDPAAYRHVQNAVGVAPGEILFFDDLVANVEAAEAAGWRAHRVDPARDPIAQMEAVLLPWLDR